MIEALGIDLHPDVLPFSNLAAPPAAVPAAPGPGDDDGAQVASTLDRAPGPAPAPAGVGRRHGELGMPHVTRSARVASALAAGTVAVLAAGAGGGHATIVPPGSLPGAGSGPARVGVILPDTHTSDRWENADRPLLAAAFEAAGVDYEIRNAEGDAANMATIADQMISGGVTVLMIVNLDNESGAQVEQRAADAGVPTIDYDRLTLGGSAAVYVSFDNVQVGVLQGEGLVECLADRGVERPAIAVLNGSPSDNNATLTARATSRCCNRTSTTAASRSSTTSRCRAGTTNRAARSSSRCCRRPTVPSMALSPPTTAWPTR